MPDQVIPGPCEDRGCPAPTEIDCIQVNKVYDFCYEADTSDDVCTPIPADCAGEVTSTSTATGSVSAVSCTVVGTTPILDANGNPTGFADVTLLITVTVQYTLTNAAGTVLCTFNGNFSFMKTILLCAPDGTTIECTAPATGVSPVAIVNGQTCSVVTVCLLVSSVALVNLLVPSYGFCTPAPCVVAPVPPFACPPSPLFPAECTGAPPTLV